MEDQQDKATSADGTSHNMGDKASPPLAISRTQPKSTTQDNHPTPNLSAAKPFPVKRLTKWGLLSVLQACDHPVVLTSNRSNSEDGQASDPAEHAPVIQLNSAAGTGTWTLQFAYMLR